MKIGYGETKTVVKFGTDGWRGIIADDFTYANVRVAARAIAHYVLEHEDAKRGRVHWVGHAVRVAVVCEGGGGGAGGGGDSGGAGVGDYAYAGAVVCGARAQGCGRRDDYVEPQSGGVEWREVQGELWRVGQAVDHDVD